MKKEEVEEEKVQNYIIDFEKKKDFLRRVLLLFHFIFFF